MTVGNKTPHTKKHRSKNRYPYHQNKGYFTQLFYNIHPQSIQRVLLLLLGSTYFVRFFYCHIVHIQKISQALPVLDSHMKDQDKEACHKTKRLALFLARKNQE